MPEARKPTNPLMWTNPKDFEHEELNLKKEDSVSDTGTLKSLLNTVSDAKGNIKAGWESFVSLTLIIFGIGLIFIIIFSAIVMPMLYSYHKDELKNLTQSYEEKLDSNKISYTHLLLFLKERDINSMAEVTATLNICEDHSIGKVDDPLVREKMNLDCVDALSKIKIQVK